MSYVITKTINGRFKYWWNKEKERWEGLISNATLFNSSDTSYAISTIRKKFLYDNSVSVVIHRRY